MSKIQLSSHTHHLWHIEDAADVERSVCAVVQCVAGFIVGLSNIAIKLFMLPLADVFGLHHPQRLQRVKQFRTDHQSHREVKGHLQTDFTYCTCRVFNRRPFRKMGKLTKLLYLVTTSAKQTTVTSVSFFSKHVVFYVNVCGFEGCTPLTRSSDENSLQSSLRWSTILVPWRTPEASAISNTPEL